MKSRRCSKCSQRSLARIAPAAALVAAMFFLAPATAAPSPGDAAAASQVPPLCTDKEALNSLKRQYEGLEELGERLKLKDIVDVKEIRFGASPASVNQYATKTTYGASSRSCQAIGRLSDGKTEPIYWRMDYLVERQGHSINYDHCSLRHSLTDSQCRSHREGK